MSMYRKNEDGKVKLDPACFQDRWDERFAVAARPLYFRKGVKVELENPAKTTPS